MSTTIDQRVVEMRFDNARFERNVATTMSSLEGLRRSLDLSGAVKGFDDIGAAAKKIDMSGLSKAAEVVQVKFSAMEVAAITAITNLTNSAVNAGKRLAASLSVDQISAGWEKFGNKTTSVGTLVSQGYDIDTVNDQLERLNWFTDETSYNFTDMVSNIAKFTASGQDLKTSVTALEGIANWAALSGQNAQAASNAMYQLSQAMGSGIMRKEDYKSIQNASMDTDEFRQKALDAGLALGKLKKNVDGTYTSLVNDQGAFTKSQFADHLTQDAWFTSDVMMKVFNDYSLAVDQIYEYAEEKGITASQAIEELGDEVDLFGLKAFKAAQEARTFPDVIDSVKDAVSTGWMNTFELIFGNYEEAKTLWTDLANAMYEVFAEGGNARNEMLEGALSHSGWNKFTDAVEDAGINLDVFESKLGESSDASGKSLAEVIDQAGSLEKAVQQGLLSTDILLQAVRNSAEELSEEELTVLNTSLKELTEGIGELSGRQHLLNAFWNVWNGIGTVLSNVKESFRDIFPATTSEQLYTFVKGLDELTERFLYFVTGSEDGLQVVSDLKSAFKGFFAILDMVKRAVTALAKGLFPLTDSISSFAQNFWHMTGAFGDWLVKLDEAAKKGDVFGKVADGISGAISTATASIRHFLQLVSERFKMFGIEGIEAVFQGITRAFENFAEAGDGVRTVFSDIVSAFGEFVDSMVEKIINADFSGVLDLLNGLSLGGIALGVTNFLKSLTGSFDEVGGILDNVKGILDGVRGCFEAYQTQLKAGTLLKIAGAIAILAASIVAISLIDSEKLNVSLGAITVLFADLVASMTLFTKISGNTKGAVKGMSAMLAMSTSVLILASVLKKIAAIEPAQLAVGLTGVTVLLGELTAVIKTLGSGASKAVKGAAQMILFATAVKILAGVAKTLAELDMVSLTKGLAGVGVLLAEVTAFLNFAKLDSRSITTAAGIVILASAMKIMASACKDFSAMNVSELAKGIGAIGVLLAELAGFTKLTDNAKNMIASGLALIEIGAAMKILASAVSDLGSMSLDTLIKGLGAMAAALTEFAIGLKAMNGSLSGSAALLVAAGALALLAPALVTLGNMSWESIAKGMLVIAGSFAAFGITGYLLKPVVPVIVAVSASISLLVGALTALMAAISVLNLTSIVAAIATPLQALGDQLSIEVLKNLAALLPEFLLGILKSLKDFIVTFCLAIAESAPAIGEAIKAVVVTLAETLPECIPVIADGALETLGGVLEALVAHAPQIIDSLMQFLVELLEGIARNLPTLIQAAVDVLMSFFSGVVDALSGVDTETLLKGIAAVGLLSGIMAALSAVAILVPGAMLGILGMGGVIAELALVLAAVGALAQLPGLSWLIGEGGKLLQEIGTAIGGFVGGIVGGFMSGVSSQFPQIGADLALFMTNIQPFIDGAKSIDGSLLEGVSALTEALLLLTGASVLSGIASWLTGGSSITAFAEDLTVLGPSLKAYSDSVAGMDPMAVENSTKALKALADFASAIPNTGGIVSWFAGDNDISAFGESLVSLGCDLQAFYTTVRDVDASKLNAVISELTALAAMISGLGTLATWGISSFGAALATLANSGIDGFVSAFADAKTTAAGAVKELLEAVEIEIERNAWRVTKAVASVAEAAYSTAMDAIGAHSPATKFIEIGMYANQGLAKGLEDYTYLVTNACTALGSKLLLALQKKLDINSPSKVTKDEVGRYIVQGIAEGITEDTSAEDAAAKKAQNIVNAFKTELDKLDLDTTTAELEYKLWSALNGDTATEGEKAGAELDLLATKLQLKAEQVQLAQAEYQTTLDNLGSTAEETQSAYNKLLQAQIDMAELSAEVTQAQNTESERQREAYLSYVNLLTENQADLLRFGYTEEEIDRWAREKSGYDPADTTASMTQDVRNAAATAMATVQTAYTNAAESTFGSLLADFSGWGVGYAESLSSGIQNGTSGVQASLETLVSNCASSIKDVSSAWYEAGSYLAEKLVEGIRSKQEEVITAAKALANVVTEVCGNVYFSSDLADETSDGMSLALGQITGCLNDALDLTPTIRPVVDLSEVEEGAVLASDLLAVNPALHVSGVAERVSSIASGVSDKTSTTDSEESEVASQTTSYHFTQNNYSPKALSRLEIYRQTKNQFSALKGVVT